MTPSLNSGHDQLHWQCIALPIQFMKNTASTTVQLAWFWHQTLSVSTEK